MSDVVERAKAALEGVTEGPWTWDGDTFSDVKPHKCPHGTQWTDHGPDLVRGNADGSTFDEWNAGNDVITSNGYDASGLEIKRADAEFIMAARDLVPELVAEIERLRAVTSPGSVSPVPASPNPPTTRTSVHSPHSGQEPTPQHDDKAGQMSAGDY